MNCDQEEALRRILRGKTEKGISVFVLPFDLAACSPCGCREPIRIAEYLRMSRELRAQTILLRNPERRIPKFDQPRPFQVEIRGKGLVHVECGRVVWPVDP